MAKKIEEFIVIGGGLMGAGIAQVISVYPKSEIFLSTRRADPFIRFQIATANIL